MTFEDKLNALIAIEGGYSNDPHDAGGETNFGITIAVARAFGYIGPMRDMTREQAKDIYRQRYWTQPRFADVAALNQDIAFEMFDTGVNMGQATAGKFLQRALNVLNQQAKVFPEVGMDGTVGNMTLAALRAFLAVRGADGALVLLRMLNAQQSVRYIELAEQHQLNEDFEFGWQLNRVGIK